MKGEKIARLTQFEIACALLSLQLIETSTHVFMFNYCHNK
jgi:hypothetical protein